MPSPAEFNAVMFLHSAVTEPAATWSNCCPRLA